MAWVVGGGVLSVWVCLSRCVEGIGHGKGCRRVGCVRAFGGSVGCSGLKRGRWLEGMCVVCVCKGCMCLWRVSVRCGCGVRGVCVCAWCVWGVVSWSCICVCHGAVFVCVQFVRPVVQTVCGACCAVFVCGPEPHLVVGWATVAFNSTRLPTGKQQCGKIG